jgi:hypothetical protein
MLAWNTSNEGRTWSPEAQPTETILANGPQPHFALGLVHSDTKSLAQTPEVSPLI